MLLTSTLRVSLSSPCASDIASPRPSSVLSRRSRASFLGARRTRDGPSACGKCERRNVFQCRGFRLLWLTRSPGSRLNAPGSILRTFKGMNKKKQLSSHFLVKAPALGTCVRGLIDAPYSPDSSRDRLTVEVFTVSTKQLQQLLCSLSLEVSMPPKGGRKGGSGERAAGLKERPAEDFEGFGDPLGASAGKEVTQGDGSDSQSLGCPVGRGSGKSQGGDL